MAAILDLDDKIVEEVCASVKEVVVPANYNSPGQIVISGSNEGIDKAIEILKEKGAKRAIKLAVGGAFHSPLMEPARLELEEAIRNTTFSKPICPVYQNVDAKPSIDPEVIKSNLVSQLTSPVRWTQSILNMISGGATSFVEVGPGNVLSGLIKKINKDAITESASF
jgi:[acyl-carrier-protein] S-malonyltransferase